MKEPEYVKICLYGRLDGQECSIKEIPEAVQCEDGTFTAFPIIGVRTKNGSIVEYFTQLPVECVVCPGLSYKKITPLSKKDKEALVSTLSVDDIVRITEKIQFFKKVIETDYYLRFGTNGNKSK